MQKLEGKTALITGGATGIGRALASALVKERMRIIIASTNPERLDAAARELRAEGGDATSLLCDVSDRDAVRKLAQEVGAVDLLCANAGVTTTGPYADHRQEDWDWAMGVNLGGVTNCVQAFYPAMVKRGSGHIMMTGSQTAYAPDWFLGHGPYVAAKAAVHALAVALRPEAARHGVGVTLLVPAYTESDILHCERARPERYGSALGGEFAVREDAPQQLSEYPVMLSAAEVAQRAIAGIKRNAPIVATHAGAKPLVEDYFARVLQAYDDAAVFETSAA